MSDPYQILGIQRTTTPLDFAKIYSEKVLPFHPARGGTQAAYQLRALAFGQLAAGQQQPLAVPTSAITDSQGKLDNQKMAAYFDATRTDHDPKDPRFQATGALSAGEISKYTADRTKTDPTYQNLFPDQQFSLHTFNTLFQKYHPARHLSEKSEGEPEPSQVPFHLDMTEVTAERDVIETISSTQKTGASVYWAWDTLKATPEHISRSAIRKASRAPPPPTQAPISKQDMQAMQAARAAPLQYDQTPLNRDISKPFTSGYSAVYEGRLSSPIGRLAPPPPPPSSNWTGVSQQTFTPQQTYTPQVAYTPQAPFTPPQASFAPPQASFTRPTQQYPYMATPPPPPYHRVPTGSWSTGHQLVSPTQQPAYFQMPQQPYVVSSSPQFQGRYPIYNYGGHSARPYY